MRRQLTFLGVSHDLSHSQEGHVLLSVLPERGASVSATCASILSAGSISPGQAASLRGKLYFSCTTALGKVGRAALQPLIERQFSKGASRTLPPSMASALASL